MRNVILVTALLVGLSPGTALAVNVASKPSDITISVSNQQFSDDAIKIRTGDTVYFKVADAVTYNIQVSNAEGDTDDKGLQKPGETIKETFPAPGEYKVRCALHPGMKLKVIVQ